MTVLRMPRAVLTTGIVVAALGLATQAKARSVGETYSCPFPKSGRVIIDTREPGATITIAEKRYPAQSGSYFYQTTNGRILVAFMPDMKRWGFQSEQLSEKPVPCTIKKNMPGKR